MINHINKRAIGKIFIFISLFLWMVDRLTNTVSTSLGKMIYSDHYIQIENGMLSDLSFNIDMYLAYSIFTVFLLGVLLYYSSMKESAQVKENIKIYDNSNN